MAIEKLKESKINFLDVNTVYHDDEETVQDLLSNYTDNYDNIVNTVNEIKKVTDNINSNIDKKVENATKEHKSYIDDYLSNVSNDVINDVSSYKTNINNKIIKHENDINIEIQKIKSDTNRIYDKYKTDIDLNLAIHKNDVNNTINANQQELKNIINNGKEELKTDLEEHKEELVNITNDFIDTNKDLYENSKIDFYGNEHKTLGNRLNADFDSVYQRINESELIPYEGSNIKADNTYYGLQKDTFVKGRTLQNLFLGKKEITVKGTASWCNATINIENLVSNKIYTFIIHNIESVSKGDYNYEPEVQIFYETLEGQRSIISILKNNDKIKLITTPSNLAILQARFIVNGGTASTTECKAIFQKFMVLEGDHTNTPLEDLPFIEGIESVGDKSKNLFDGVLIEKTNSTDFEKIKNGFRFKRINGTGIQACVGFRIPRGTFNISYNVKGGIKSGNLIVRIGNKAEAGFSNGGVINSEIGIGQEKEISVNFTNTANDLIVFYTDQYESTFEITNIQIEEGTQATPYEPYYDGYKISGKANGKNLFDGDWKIGNINSNNGVFGNGGFMFINRYPIKIKPNTSYIFSTNQEDIVVHMIGYYNNGIFIRSETPNASPKKFNSGNSNECYVVLSYKDLSTGKVDYNVEVEKYFKNIVQLEEGTQGTPYEPYQESTYSYILNEPLRSLPNGVCDEIDLTTGVLTRRVGKVELSECTGMYEYQHPTLSNYPTHIGFALTIFNNVPKYYSGTEANIGFSNRGHVVGLFTLLNAVNDINLTPHENGNLYISILKSELKTLDVNGFKDWLQANPTTVIYELAEPTIEQLTPQQLKSFDTTTHIISDNKLMPIVSTKIHSNVQAIISTLRLENDELKNNVETISNENESLKETVNTQNDLIDTSLCACDELYCMIENLIPEVIE